MAFSGGKDLTDEQIARMFGLPANALSGPATALTAASEKLRKQAEKLGAIPKGSPQIIFRNDEGSPEKMFASLLSKGSDLLEELFSRLLLPNDGSLMSFGKEQGPAAFPCIMDVYPELQRTIYLRDTYLGEVREPVPTVLKINKESTALAEALENIKQTEELSNPTNPALSRPASEIKYSEYNIRESRDASVNFLISLSILLQKVAASPNCKIAPRVSKFSLNTTSRGKDSLGTKTFGEDVKYVLKYIVEHKEFLEQAAVWARMLKEEDDNKKRRYQNLVERLRALSRPDSGGGGAGGYSGRGGYRKSRKNRKVNKTRKTNKSRKAKKANRKTKSRRHH